MTDFIELYNCSYNENCDDCMFNLFLDELPDFDDQNETVSSVSSRRERM